MKYKIGNKVIIKTWDKMVKQYGYWNSVDRSSILTNKELLFIKAEERAISKFNNDRVVTIRKYGSEYNCDNYLIEEYVANGYCDWHITNEMIEEKYVPPNPIKTRFEILDL